MPALLRNDRDSMSARMHLHTWYFQMALTITNPGPNNVACHSALLPHNAYAAFSACPEDKGPPFLTLACRPVMHTPRAISKFVLASEALAGSKPLGRNLRRVSVKAAPLKDAPEAPPTLDKSQRKRLKLVPLVSASRLTKSPQSICCVCQCMCKWDNSVYLFAEISKRLTYGHDPNKASNTLSGKGERNTCRRATTRRIQHMLRPELSARCSACHPREQSDCEEGHRRKAQVRPTPALWNNHDIPTDASRNV